MRDVDTSISTALEDAEDSGASGGSCKTGIQVASEGGLLFSIGFLVELVTIDLDLTLVHRVKTELLENSSADQKTGGVSGGVVGETDADAESWELVGVGRGDNDISLESSVSDLGDDVLEGN